MKPSVTLAPRFAGTLSLAVVLMAFPAETRREPVISELARKQSNAGLTIAVSKGASSGIVRLRDRSFQEMSIGAGKDALLSKTVWSWDGTLLAASYVDKDPSSKRAEHLVLATPTGDMKHFDHITYPWGMSISPDKKHLILSSSTEQDNVTIRGLQLLEIESGRSRPIDPEGSAYNPCWASDGHRFVFVSRGRVRLYDLRDRTTKEVGEGWDPTWSPNGEWILYKGKDTNFLHSTLTGATKQFRSKKSAMSQFSWSPDSQYVAYIARGGSAWSLQERSRLWVRRMDDGAEEWVWEFSSKGPPVVFQWVQNPQFIKKDSR